MDKNDSTKTTGDNPQSTNPEQYIADHIGQFVDGDLLITDDEETMQACSQCKISLTNSRRDGHGA